MILTLWLRRVLSFLKLQFARILLILSFGLRINCFIVKHLKILELDLKIKLQLIHSFVILKYHVNSLKICFELTCRGHTTYIFSLLKFIYLHAVINSPKNILIFNLNKQTVLVIWRTDSNTNLTIFGGLLSIGRWIRDHNRA